MYFIYLFIIYVNGYRTRRTVLKNIYKGVCMQFLMHRDLRAFLPSSEITAVRFFKYMYM